MASDMITVQVDNQILWVGSEAYPLRNIARAQTARILPPVRWAVVRLIRAVFVWLVLGIGAYSAIRYGGVRVTGMSRSELLEVLSLIMLGLILIAVLIFIKRVAIGKVYALIIETAGSPRAALLSRDFTKLNGLVHGIMNAINNPGRHANFVQHVTNVKIDHIGNNNFSGPNFGSIINQTGSGSRVSG